MAINGGRKRANVSDSESTAKNLFGLFALNVLTKKIEMDKPFGLISGLQSGPVLLETAQK